MRSPTKSRFGRSCMAWPVIAFVTCGALVTNGQDGSTGDLLLPDQINIGLNRIGFVQPLGNGSYTIIGGGGQIGDSTDALTFAYTEVTGDFDVQARVTNLEQGWDNAKAGIMIRLNLAEDSPMFFVRVTPAYGV